MYSHKHIYYRFEFKIKTLRQKIKFFHLAKLLKDNQNYLLNFVDNILNFENKY